MQQLVPTRSIITVNLQKRNAVLNHLGGFLLEVRLDVIPWQSNATSRSPQPVEMMPSGLFRATWKCINSGYNIHVYTFHSLGEIGRGHCSSHGTSFWAVHSSASPGILLTHWQWSLGGCSMEKGSPGAHSLCFLQDQNTKNWKYHSLMIKKHGYLFFSDCIR